MYNREIIGQLVDFISSKDGRTDKSRLQNEVQEAFGLVKDRSVYYCDWFAIRFCKAASRSFGNVSAGSAQPIWVGKKHPI